MAAAYVTTITQTGLDLIAQALAKDEVITFTRLVTGNGEYGSSVDLETVTGLVNQKQEVTFTKKGYTETATIALVAVVTNTGLEESYYITEVGTYANDLDGNEILFSISVPAEEVADYMPSEDYGLASIQMEVDTSISNTDTVKVVYTGAYALAADFEELKEQVEVQEEEINALAGSVSEVYSEDTAYEAGVYFIKDNVLYLTISAMEAGTWDDSAVKVINVTQLIEELQDNTDELINMIIAGTVTAPMLTEDSKPILTEDGEVILATRHVG